VGGEDDEDRWEYRQKGRPGRGSEHKPVNSATCACAWIPYYCTHVDAAVSRSQSHTGVGSTVPPAEKDHGSGYTAVHRNATTHLRI